MHVRDLMTTDVVVAHPDTSLKAVARLLLDNRISGVPVVDADGQVLGIVSEADLLVKEAGEPVQVRRSPLRWLLGEDRETEAARQRITAVTAGEAMTTPVATIEADRPLSEAARRMTEGRINRLPVVDGGRLAGIITRADIVRAYARSDDELLTAAVTAVRAIDGLRVEEVDDGVVRIAGSVSHASVAATARKVLVAIDGVVAVDDRDVSWPEEPEAPPPAGWSREGMGPRSA